MIIDEMAQYSDAKGVTTYVPDGRGGNTFLHRLPNKPDIAIALYNTSGMAPDMKTGLKRPGVQITVRGDTDPRTAFQLAQQVLDTFHSPDDKYFVDGGTLILMCSARQSEPIALGPDEQGRYECSLNFQLITGGS